MTANNRTGARTPVIALVGRPNVGKSTLFNRLTRSRSALVANIPGLTRDRHYAPASSGGRRYVLIDTGGFEPVADSGVEAQMARQARQAILEADLVIFVTDARQGLTARDAEIANELRRTARQWRLVVNKAEGLDRPVAEADFHSLGLGDPVAISAAHGDRVSSLMEDCLDDLGIPHPEDLVEDPDEAPPTVEELAAVAQEPDLPEAARVPGTSTWPPGPAVPGVESAARPGPALAYGVDPTRPIRVAIVGRPNGGKSTLINALIGEERLVAFDQPGTTRDSIEVPFRQDDRSFTLIDTAGIRRRGKVHEVIEKFSVVKTLQAIEDCNVCVMVIDSADGISDQDAAIAGYILESGRALVVALNKWDAVDRDQRDWIRREFERKLHFLSFARMLPISARHRRGLPQMMQAVVAAYAAATAKLSTPKLTRMMMAAVEHQHPVRKGPIRPKLRYAHQGGQNPPIVVIHGSALDHLSDTYLRFLEGWFRERLSLQGTPLRIELRSGRNPFVKTPRR